MGASGRRHVRTPTERIRAVRRSERHQFAPAICYDVCKRLAVIAGGVYEVAMAQARTRAALLFSIDSGYNSFEIGCSQSSVVRRVNGQEIHGATFAQT